MHFINLRAQNKTLAPRCFSVLDKTHLSIRFNSQTPQRKKPPNA